MEGWRDGGSRMSVYERQTGREGRRGEEGRRETGRTYQAVRRLVGWMVMLQELGIGAANRI